MTAQRRAEDLATFVVVIGMAPSDYWALTQRQRLAIITEFNKRNKRNKQK